MTTRTLLVGTAFVMAMALPRSASAHGGKVLSEMACPVEEPMGMAVRGEHLWIADMATRAIYQVRKSDGGVVRRLDAAGFAPTGLAWHEDTLYSADRWLDWIARRRPGGEPDGDLSPIPYYEKWAMGMAHDGEHLWVVDARASKLHRIDTEDGTTIESFAAPAGRPAGIAFDGHYLWVSDHETDQIYMVDRRDGRALVVLPAPGPYPSALAADGDSLWVADYETRRLYRVALPDDTPYVEDEPRRVRVSYEVAYRAKGRGKVAGLTAHVALPREIPGQHLLSDLRFDPAPTRRETDRWGQEIAVFELGTLESGEQRSIRWEGDFALYRLRFHIVPERVQAARMPTDLGDYLADDKKYDLESSVIRDIVDDVTREEGSTYWRVRSIYEHLSDVISYDRSSGWNNAATVLERGTGSCSEYTFALVALLRRAGIPARYVGAVSERSGDASFDDVFHRWAEAWVPGYGWVPLDANAAHGKPPGERAAFFGGRTNRHVVTTIGGGASDHLGWDYNHHEEYRTEDGAELAVLPIARYRPLEGDEEVSAPEAQAVLAPRLSRPVERGAPEAEERETEPTSPWLVAIAVLVAILVGFVVGAAGRLRRREQ